jgi:hypothetical protein
LLEPSRFICANLKLIKPDQSSPALELYEEVGPGALQHLFPHLFVAKTPSWCAPTFFLN